MTRGSIAALELRSSPRRSGRLTCDTPTLLRLVSDEYSQQILECIDVPMTVGAIAAQCAIPTSTAYRKIEQLDDAGLVEESIRPSSSGRHATEYQRAIDELYISIGRDIEVECRFR